MNQNLSIIRTLAFASSLLFIISLARASTPVSELRVYESFNYGTHNNSTKFLRGANDHNGGSGWADEWKAVSSDEDTTGGVRMDLAEISIQSETSLTSAGGRVSDSNGGYSRREFSSPVGDLYFSALINWGAGSTMSMNLGNTTHNRWMAFDINSDGHLKIGVSSLGSEFYALNSGTDYLVVGRRTSVGNERTIVASVFETNDPALLTNPNPTDSTGWYLTSSASSSVTLSHLDLEVGGSGTAMIDEIRFGTTYESVVGTAVPERKQAACMVGLLCLLSLVARRRLHMS